jgi:hypothetical protein
VFDQNVQRRFHTKRFANRLRGKIKFKFKVREMQNATHSFRNEKFLHQSVHRIFKNLKKTYTFLK